MNLDFLWCYQRFPTSGDDCDELTHISTSYFLLHRLIRFTIRILHRFDSVPVCFISEDPERPRRMNWPFTLSVLGFGINPSIPQVPDLKCWRRSIGKQLKWISWKMNLRRQISYVRCWCQFDCTIDGCPGPGWVPPNFLVFHHWPASTAIVQDSAFIIRSHTRLRSPPE